MSELTRCRNCRSNKWELVTIIPLPGRGKTNKTLFQCQFCKRVIGIDGEEIPESKSPLDVI